MSKVLLDQEKIATSITGAIAFRIRYRSQDLNGVATESTGVVIAPEDTSAERNVISWTHGTTGTGDAACPSAQPDPARELTLYYTYGSQTQIDYGVPGLQKFIDDGYVVVATDYQGLGTPGVHQYTVNRTQAIDAVMIVHAARELSIGAGKRFGVIGWSQGGGTAAAAVELDETIYGELEVVGAVCQSPGIPIIGLKQPSMGGVMADNDVPPDGHLFMSLGGFAAAFPDKLSLDDVFTPLGRRVWDEGWNTQPVHHLTDVLGRVYKHEGQVMKIDREKFPVWIEALTAGCAGLKKPVAPVLVQIDTQFEDGPLPIVVQPVPRAWQHGYVDVVKQLGGDISFTEYPNDDHFSLPQNGIDEAREWFSARFGG